MVGPPPLTGLKVLELAGLAPAPYAGLLLADAGATVLRIDRVPSGPSSAPTGDPLARHKASIAVDLRSPRGVALVRELARHADVLIDPFRPGVLERLGLGPADLLPGNPRLVYARLSGFRRGSGDGNDGDSSRYSAMAGHDINYLAVAGVLSLLGRKGSKPTPPINLLADFAGGGATLVLGVLLALLTRERTGKGQVVEANMVDGAAYLASFPRFMRQTPAGDKPRGENLLDSGCPFYDTYETRDGRWMAVGALEPQFYTALLKGLGLGGRGWEERRHDRRCWDEMRAAFEAAFRNKTRDEWERVFDGTDACCTPVLELDELQTDPQREGDQRPAVTLRDSPLLGVKQGASHVSQGQGPGVEGNGYVGTLLSPGEGGEDLLGNWLGWSKGKDFEVERGAGTEGTVEAVRLTRTQSSLSTKS